MTDKKRVFTVLVIDGGGVRGIIPARILEDIEQRTGKPAAELFDLIGGTSTGAIVAGGLVVPDPANPGKPKYSAKELKDFYYKYAPKIFPEMMFKSLRQLSSSTVYDPRPLEEALEKHFGDTRLKDTLTHLMIPVTDLKNFRPRWIKHIKGHKDTSPEGWSSMLLTDAIRATTMVPTYFPAKYYQTTPHEDMPDVTHRHALIDGGFFGGNTLRRLLTQAKRLAPPDAEIVIVHIGTGNVDNSLSPSEFNKLGPLGMLSKSRGSILMSFFMGMTTLDVVEDVREEIGERLISLDGMIDFEDRKNHPSISMDDASQANMKKLEKLAETILEENDAEVARLCKILERRTYAQACHNDSQAALQALSEKMDAVRTVKSLNRMYRSIVKYSTDLDDGKIPPADLELKQLAAKLTEPHKIELDRVYHVVRDKLESQSGLVNSVKETGDNLNKWLKRISGPFNDSAEKRPQDTPPPANNDNKPPAANHGRWWKFGK